MTSGQKRLQCKFNIIFINVTGFPTACKQTPPYFQQQTERHERYSSASSGVDFVGGMRYFALPPRPCTAIIEHRQASETKSHGGQKLLCISF